MRSILNTHFNDIFDFDYFDELASVTLNKPNKKVGQIVYNNSLDTLLVKIMLPGYEKENIEIFYNESLDEFLISAKNEDNEKVNINLGSLKNRFGNINLKEVQYKNGELIFIFDKNLKKIEIK